MSLICAFLGTILSLLLNSATQAQTPPDPAIDNQQIIQRIDSAVYQRSNAISRYNVQEQYNLYRNGAADPAAQETIRTAYNRATGKDYTTLAQSGSALFRSAVIDKLLSEEKDLNLPANRESSWITSSNYQMRPHPGTVQQNGRDCILVDLKPRRKSPHLFDGKIWVDASDFTVVRLEGTPSQSPSFFAGQTSVARDYARVNGFSMATHAEAHSHSALLGDTVLMIEYTGYQIELNPAP